MDVRTHIPQGSRSTQLYSPFSLINAQFCSKTSVLLGYFFTNSEVFISAVMLHYQIQNLI